MRYLLAFTLTLALAVPAWAAFEGPGATPDTLDQSALTGSKGSQAGTVSTVADIMKSHDDTRCTLEGRIVEKVAGSKDKYVFEDATGKIVVEIDHKKFADRLVTPQHTVRIRGEVDARHSGQRQVDVDALEIVK